jgi:hypothetical protein
MVSVITTVYNKPEFIDIQFKLLKKNLLDNFTYTVYDNSDNSLIKQQIIKVCSDYNINYVSIPQNIHKNYDPSSKAGQSLDWAISHNVNNIKSEKMMILDSDMFLIEPTSFDSEILNYDIVGIYQERDHVFYYTNQLVFLNLKNLPNFINVPKFLPGVIDGKNTDCGGYLYNYINENNVKHKNIDYRNHSGTINKSNLNLLPDYFIDYFSQELNFMEKSFAETFSKFLHFRAGSNWINFDKNLQEKREKNLINYINKILLK